MNIVLYYSVFILFLVSNSFAQYSAKEIESLSLDWPDEENWKVGSSQENSQMTMIEFIKNDETLENWSEMGSMISYKGVKDRNVEEVMQILYASVKKDCADANLTILKKDITIANPWVIFSIECAKYKNTNAPESQVWYLIQGREALYSNIRSLKTDSIPETIKHKFVNFFSSAKLVYR